ncbi:hypothetical protein [Luteimicrobium album]|uniref:hypothetical protein n=1 Tax=Luteimicrobium album TaxID=1054550 RepID=UPI0024E10346|nr:hypothetical protein [Luteimicrobium album]
MSTTHGAPVGQGALALDGTQLDLFDVLAADGGEASAWGRRRRRARRSPSRWRCAARTRRSRREASTGSC